MGAFPAVCCPPSTHQQVIAGKDKGTVAEVEKVNPTRGMIVVKGVNVKVCVRERMVVAVEETGSQPYVCPSA